MRKQPTNSIKCLAVWGMFIFLSLGAFAESNPFLSLRIRDNSLLPLRLGTRPG